jgi:iron complex outermembrane receptor protein
VSSDGISPRVILTYEPSNNLQFNAQVAEGFRLGGINDPLNVTLCQGNDQQTYGGRENWEDEEVMNYELGMKSRLNGGRVTFNAAVFMSQIDNLQVIADAGSCSSRIILNAEAESIGAEMELFVRPSESWDFGISATYVQAEITESLFATGTTTPIAGIRNGNRLPTSPELQAAASAGYYFPMASLESYVRITMSHIGSSYTQLADQEPGFGFISNAPGAPAGVSVACPRAPPSSSTPNCRPTRSRTCAGVSARRAGKAPCSSTTCSTNAPSCPSIVSAGAARVWVISPTRLAPMA